MSEKAVHPVVLSMIVTAAVLLLNAAERGWYPAKRYQVVSLMYQKDVSNQRQLTMKTWKLAADAEGNISLLIHTDMIPSVSESILGQLQLVHDVRLQSGNFIEAGAHTWKFRLSQPQRAQDGVEWVGVQVVTETPAITTTDFISLMELFADPDNQDAMSFKLFLGGGSVLNFQHA